MGHSLKDFYGIFDFLIVEILSTAGCIQGNSVAHTHVAACVSQTLTGHQYFFFLLSLRGRELKQLDEFFFLFLYLLHWELQLAPSLSHTCPLLAVIHLGTNLMKC